MHDPKDGREHFYFSYFLLFDKDVTTALAIRIATIASGIALVIKAEKIAFIAKSGLIPIASAYDLAYIRYIKPKTRPESVSYTHLTLPTICSV